MRAGSNLEIRLDKFGKSILVINPCCNLCSILTNSLNHGARLVLALGRGTARGAAQCRSGGAGCSGGQRHCLVRKRLPDNRCDGAGQCLRLFEGNQVARIGHGHQARAGDAFGQFARFCGAAQLVLGGGDH